MNWKPKINKKYTKNELETKNKPKGYKNELEAKNKK